LKNGTPAVGVGDDDIDDVQLVKIGASADGTTATKITVYW
jgi:hypothetical protein